MFLNKLLIAFFIAFTSFAVADDGWVSVARPERVVHQWEEDDSSIWIVFAKTFGQERILIRFPEDPVYRHLDGRFQAAATHLGIGEMSLIVRKKETPSAPVASRREVSYRDADSGRWIRERHIETDEYHYVLRASMPTESATLYRQFVDSFEIEHSLQ